MSASLPIGDFARATHLSVKTLRYYHRVGVLEPADIDPNTGYRRYQTDQIPVAQIIRRFRSLDLPIEDIQAVLAAPDMTARNQVIAAHLSRLEATLQRTQQSTASLRDLLQPQTPTAPADLAHRSVPATTAAAITATIDIKDASAWYQGALGELHTSLASQNTATTGPAGGIYSNDLFTEERGEATVFLPCDLTFRSTGRIDPLVIPAVELATTHAGPHNDIDRSYGALATYVAHHALGINGPIREYYLVDRHTTTDHPNGAPRSAGRSSTPPYPAEPRSRLRNSTRGPADHRQTQAIGAAPDALPFNNSARTKRRLPDSHDIAARRAGPWRPLQPELAAPTKSASIGSLASTVVTRSATARLSG